MKKLRGRKVLLSIPQIEKSGLELTPEVEQQLAMENYKKFSQLEVFDVSLEVTDLQKGDKVFISSEALHYSQKVEVDGEPKALVEDSVISIIW